MKIIFMGTPEFAVPCLEAIVKEHEVVAVITQPDKAQGRGRKIIPTPIKKSSLLLGLTVKQPQNVNDKDMVDYLQELNADLMVVVAYGQILKKRVLNTTPMGAINVHASLLPKWRGGAPIHRSILNGDKETGVSIMKIEPKLDSGPVYLQKKVVITEDVNVGSLHDDLAIIGAQMLVKVLRNIPNIIPEIQDHKESTYAHLVEKEDRIINWENSLEVIYNQIRGLNPWPIAYTYYRGKQIQIWESKKIDFNKLGNKKYGQIIDITSEGPIVKCSNGALLITKVKPAGKKLMSGCEFCRGYRCNTSDIFGERKDAK